MNLYMYVLYVVPKLVHNAIQFPMKLHLRIGSSQYVPINGIKPFEDESGQVEISEGEG